MSFYEMNLIAERNKFQHYRNLDYVRHVMLAAGQWKRGTTVEKILPLPTDKLRPKPNAPENMEHAKEIVNSLLQYLPKK